MVFDCESRVDAQSFFHSFCHFPFIVTLTVATEILAYTKALSVKLQGWYLDIVWAYREVRFVKSALKSAREGFFTFHSWIYCKAMQIASEVNVQEKVPWTTGRQHHQNNVPASSPSQYYQNQITIPMLAWPSHFWDGIKFQHSNISHCWPDNTFSALRAGKTWFSDQFKQAHRLGDHLWRHSHHLLLWIPNSIVSGRNGRALRTSHPPRNSTHHSKFCQRLAQTLFLT